MSRGGARNRCLLVARTCPVAQSSDPSHRFLRRPRNETCVKRRAARIWPKTGSTVAFRRAYACRPRLVSRSARISSLAAIWCCGRGSSSACDRRLVGELGSAGNSSRCGGSGTPHGPRPGETTGPLWVRNPCPAYRVALRRGSLQSEAVPCSHSLCRRVLPEGGLMRRRVARALSAARAVV